MITVDGVGQTRQKSYDITYMWNLKYGTGSQTQTDSWLPGAGGMEGKLGLAEQTAAYRTDEQRGPAGTCTQSPAINVGGKGRTERVYITELLCGTAESHTML